MGAVGGRPRIGAGKLVAIGTVLGAAALVAAAAAGSVTILQSGPYAEAGGFFDHPYYEDLNAPTASAYTLDTVADKQPNPTTSTLALDGAGSAAWSSGSSFAITVSTTAANDVIVLWIVTFVSGSSDAVTSITDAQGKVAWQAAARLAFTSCTGADETTETEWYGIASSVLASDAVTVHLAAPPTAAEVQELGVMGANTQAPFDPNAAALQSASACSGVAAQPSVSGVSTTNPNDFAVAFFASAVATTESVGTIGGSAATALTGATGGTGDSMAGEYRIVAQAQASQSCSFATPTTFWAVACDALAQSSGSFSLPAASTMYLWSPALPSGATVPAGSLGLNLFADLAAPGLDGSATGTWTSGSTFTVPLFTTLKNPDIIILNIVTFSSGASIGASSVSDSAAGVAWQGSARNSFVTCSGSHETTHIEWYGVSSGTLSSDTITVHLASAPAAASAIAFGVSGADTTAPFDISPTVPATAASGCTGSSTTPTVASVGTVADTDFVFALFGSQGLVTETAGTLLGGSAMLVTTQAGTSVSAAAEELTTATNKASSSCSFGTATTFWGILCDAIVPLRQTVTVAAATTNGAGTVQSTLVGSTAVTITGSLAPITLASAAGTVPASGYVRVTVVAPAGSALTINWGGSKPTDFQILYTYKS